MNVLDQTLELKDSTDSFCLKINGTEIAVSSYTVKNSTKGVVELSLQIEFMSDNSIIGIEKNGTKKVAPTITIDTSTSFDADELASQIEDRISRICDEVLDQEELVIKVPLSTVLIAEPLSHYHFERLLKEDPQQAINWVENGLTEMPKGTFNVVIFEN